MKKNEEENLKKRLKQIIKNLDESVPSLNLINKFTIYSDNNKKNIIINTEQYMWAFYQTLFTKYTYSISPIEILYNMVGVNNSHCTGKVYFTYEYKLKTDKSYITNSDFTTKLINRVRTCKSLFTSVNVILIPKNSSAHANMLFTYYDKKREKIKISLYDPNGSGIDKDYLSHKLLELIKNENPSLFEIIPRTDISCVEGMQTYTSDYTGFCVMFSFFWLYCILNISKNNSDIKLEEIKYVEKLIIGMLPPKILYNIVMKFMTIFTHECFEKGNIGNMKVFNEHFFTTAVTQVDPMFIFNNKESQPSYFGKFMDFFKLNNIEKTMINEQEKKANETTIKRKNNENCIVNDDCFSDLCKNNKCISYQKYSDSLKKNNTECKNDDECYSGMCKNNICSVGEYLEDQPNPKKGRYRFGKK